MNIEIKLMPMPNNNNRVELHCGDRDLIALTIIYPDELIALAYCEICRRIEIDTEGKIGINLKDIREGK